MSARADLCGGRSVMIVPTATSSNMDYPHERRIDPENRPSVRDCSWTHARSPTYSSSRLSFRHGGSDTVGTDGCYITYTF